MRTAAWAGALVAALLLAGNTAARPRKGKGKPTPAPAAEPAPEPAPPVTVPTLLSTRPDGLKIAVVPVPGPAVALRVALNLRGTAPRHPSASVARLVGLAALYGGPASEVLGAGGADRRVTVVGDAVVLCVDTLRERWKDDLAALLDAVSSPGLDEATLLAASYRGRPFGPVQDVRVLFHQLSYRLDVREVALNPLGMGQPDPSLDAAVWFMEETVSAERMTLIIAGELDAAEAAAVVEQHFLVPGSPARADPPGQGTRLEAEDTHDGAMPWVANGAYAREVPPADAVVIAELWLQRVLAEQPRAGDCVGAYQPEQAEPSVLVVCSGVEGTALDVRETVGRILDAAAPPPTAAQWKDARTAATGRLRSDHASASRYADRVARWGAAGWDGAAGLEAAVAATQESSLNASLALLLGPGRAIRLHGKGRGGE